MAGRFGSLARLTVFYSLVEAEVFMSMLRAHGIFAIGPSAFVRNAPHLMTAAGGIEIHVLDSDLETARALLHAVAEGEAQLLEAEPACLRSAIWAGLTGLLAINLGAAPAPTPPRLRPARQVRRRIDRPL